MLCQYFNPHNDILFVNSFTTLRTTTCANTIVIAFVAVNACIFCLQSSEILHIASVCSLVCQYAVQQSVGCRQAHARPAWYGAFEKVDAKQYSLTPSNAISLLRHHKRCLEPSPKFGRQSRIWKGELLFELRNVGKPQIGCIWYAKEVRGGLINSNLVLKHPKQANL